jgi:hypothetical protein
MLEQASIKFRLKIEFETRIRLATLNIHSEKIAKFEEKNANIATPEFNETQNTLNRLVDAAGRLKKTVEDEQPERRVYEKAVVALEHRSSSIFCFLYNYLLILYLWRFYRAEIN